jgi:hypothetical protein
MRGDIVLVKLTDVVDEGDDLVEFAGRGGEGCSDVERAGDVESAGECVGCTTGRKTGYTDWGRSWGSSLNLPPGAAGVKRKNDTLSARFLQKNYPSYQPPYERYQTI